MSLIPFGILLIVVGTCIAVWGPKNSATTVQMGKSKLRIVHSLLGGILIALLGLGLLIGGIIETVLAE